MNKLTIAAFVVVLAVAGGAYFYPKFQASVGTTAAPAGSTFSNAKSYAIAMAPLTDAATSTTIYNSDATDRFVTGGYAVCGGLDRSGGPLGAGYANFGFKAATSSTDVGGTRKTANTQLALNVLVSTSTVDGITATTSPTGTTPAFWFRWAAGSYMNFYTNATNTAACTVGVNTVSN